MESQHMGGRAAVRVPSIPRRGLGLLIYTVGFLLAIYLLGHTVWAYFEAQLFDPWTSLAAEAKLTTLECPLVIARAEGATVRLTLENPLERPIRRLVRLQVPEGYITLLSQEEQWVDLAPGARRTLEWHFGPERGVYGGRFLFVSAYASGRTPIPAQEGRCGIWIMPLAGVPGNLAWGAGILGAWMAMVSGLALRGHRWRDRERLNTFDTGLRVVLGAYTVGLLAMVGGRWWFVAGLALLLAGVLFGTLLLRALQDW